LYLSVVEVAEPPDFPGLVEGVAGDLHVAHDAEFPEVSEEIRSGDGGLEGDAVFGQFIECGLFLSEGGLTKSPTSSATVANLLTPWNNLSII